MDKLTIFTKKDCEKCDMIKSKLKDKKIKFIEKSIEDPNNLTELIVAGVEINEAPVIEKNGQFFTNKNGLLRAINE